MVSFSVVSEIAMVPDSECSTPTLMVSAAEAIEPNSELAASAATTDTFKSFFFIRTPQSLFQVSQAGISLELTIPEPCQGGYPTNAPFNYVK
jgi:hypothetical protein